MAELQKYFEKFHNDIRLDYSSNSALAEKRDIVIKKISESLKKSGYSGFETVLQGSYKMHTGVYPPKGKEFDIDVGLRFAMKEQVPSKALRLRVYNAVAGHTDVVEQKTSCIRVRYKTVPPYHLDLVVYSDVDSKVQLATSDGWKNADPDGLLKYVTDAQKRFPESNGSTGIDQLRRTIRYLKRWGDERPIGTAKRPSGLAYTLLAIHDLEPTKGWDGSLDDASALEALVRRASEVNAVTAIKPTPEYENMFGMLSLYEMQKLQSDFLILANVLESAMNEPDPYEACLQVREVLGSDFPVPPKESTGKRTSAPAIITSSSSA